MKKRLFLAINFPETVLNEVYTIQQELKQHNKQPGIAWVEKGNIHLTVFFIDEVSEDLVPTIIDALEKNVPKTKFSLFVRPEIGGFPNSKRPKVVFVKVNDSEKLRGLVNAVEKALYSLHIPERDNLFHPHITLAKIKDAVFFATGTAITIRNNESPVESIDLMESVLMPTGSKYLLVKKIALT